MAHVERRGPRKYRARYRDPSGAERSQTFTTRKRADDFLTEIEHAKRVGGYVDPADGPKLPKEITSHDLRHFYASLLIRHGESVKRCRHVSGTPPRLRR